MRDTLVWVGVGFVAYCLGVVLLSVLCGGSAHADRMEGRGL